MLFRSSSRLSFCIAFLTILLQLHSLWAQPLLACQNCPPPRQNTQDGFDWLYDLSTATIDQLEDETYLEEMEMRDFQLLTAHLCHLAAIGSASSASQWEQIYLEQEISDLLALTSSLYAFEEMWTFAKPLPLQNQGWTFDTETSFEIMQAKSFWKKIAHKVRDFVKKHKTAIIIGAVAVGAAAIVWGVSAVVAAGAAAALSDAHSDHDHHPHPDDQKAPDVQTLKQEITEILSSETSSAEIQEIVFSHSPSEALPETSEPTAEDLYAKESIREHSSCLTHALWHELTNQVSGVLYSVESVGRNMLAEGELAHEPYESALCSRWVHERIEPVGQEAIDALFSTDYETLEHVKKYETGVEIATWVVPLGPVILKGAAKVVDIAKTVAKLGTQGMERGAAAGLIEEMSMLGQIEKGAGIAEELNVLSKPGSPVLTPPKGIWELEGKNIQRVDWGKMSEQKRMDHIFKPEHNLDRLGLTPQATYEKVTEAMIEADKAGLIPANQHFEVRVNVNRLLSKSIF
jgi:hypothetical protein